MDSTKWAQDAGVPTLTQALTTTQKTALGYCLTHLVFTPHEGLHLRPTMARALRNEGSHHHNRISAAAGPPENKVMKGTI